MDDRLLTTEDVAAYLHVAVETVRYWRKQGRGPRAVKVGHAVRYRSTDLEVWLAERTDRVPA